MRRNREHTPAASIEDVPTVTVGDMLTAVSDSAGPQTVTTCAVCRRVIYGAHADSDGCCVHCRVAREDA